MLKRINWKVFISSAIIVFLVATIGGVFTSQSTNSEWYESIKPSITPPNYVFPIVWNFLFILIIFSVYFSWMSSRKIQDKRRIALLFGINFFLNILWSVFYFGMRNPFFAFIELIFLWASILLLILGIHRISRKASYLLIPYFLWVSFAGILNYLSI